MYKRIRKLRLESRLTQHEVAQVLHISDSSYARLENGTRKMLLSELRQLALFYQVSADYILELTRFWE
ncbi:MAG: helix-turn-helix transcriptional regulator [Clostridiales bacterium]|nr:helix-turn-helix transcriptional regulator [Clostridiales bacterium]